MTAQAPRPLVQERPLELGSGQGAAQASPAPAASAAPAASTAKSAQAPRRPAGRATRRRKTGLRARALAMAGYAALGLLFLIVAAVSFLVVAPPVDITRERVMAEFRARTGYVLEINGKTSLSLFPTPALEFRDVVVATSALGGAPVLRAEAVEIEAVLWPLLIGRLQAERVSLRRPQLDLVVNKEGRRTWLKADTGPLTTRKVRVARVTRDGVIVGTAGRFSPPGLQDDEDETDGETGARPPGRGTLSAGDLNLYISDGIVRYRDLRTGKLTQADQIQLRVTQREERATAPFRVRGSLVFNGESLKLDVRTDPREGWARSLERVALRVAGQHGHFSYQGAIGSGGQLLQGDLDLATPSAVEAGRWLGMRLRDGPLLAGELALKGHVRGGADRAILEDATLRIDAAEAKGRLEIDLSGQRPRFAADLALAELDLDQMRQRAQDARTRRRDERDAMRGTRRPEPSDESPSARPSEEIQDANSRPDREERASRAWRTEPIAFANLSSLEGEARLRAARVIWRGAALSDAAGMLSLSDGTMKIDLREGQLHGGTARGVITASAAGHVGVDLALDGVDTLEILSRAAHFDALSGPARIRLAVSGHGASEQDIIRTLVGSASLEIERGALIGWSVNDILASVRRLDMPKLERSTAARTPFSRLTAAFSIKDGIATATDLRIAATPVALDSTGTIDLPSRTMDLTLNPRLAEAAASGSTGRLAGLTVPLQLQGPWQRPRLTADYQRILKNPQKVIEGAREAARGIKDEDVDRAAKRLLGNTPEAEKGARRAKELLRRFLAD